MLQSETSLNWLTWLPTGECLFSDITVLDFPGNASLKFNSPGIHFFPAGNMNLQ